jgi:YabP family.
MEKQKNHSLLLEDGRLSVTGVMKVTGSNGRELTLELSSARLIIRGDGFNVDSLDLEVGRLSASGNIKEIKYLSAHEKQAVFKRLFK